MNRHQPQLLLKYMRQSHHKLVLRTMVCQESGAGLEASAATGEMNARSASLTPGCSDGVSRNQTKNPATQAAPTRPKRAKALRHPKASALRPIKNGAAAPPQRPNTQGNPWARPRW